MKKIILGSLFVASSVFAGDVLAVVNGEKITKQEINNVLKRQHMTYDQLPPKFRAKILDDIITQALVIQKAENSGIEKTKLYKKELNIIKKQLAYRLFLQNKLKSFKITDQEAKSFYNKNKDILFKRKEEIKARHILVRTKAEAMDIINKLKKIPQSKLDEEFAKLAQKYSIGPSGKMGGELGWFSKDKMIPAFSKVAFSLKKGEFTLKPVHTRFGWHIIYVEDKKPAGYIPFNKVKNRIKNQLKVEKLRAYIQNLKQKAKIEYK